VELPFMCTSFAQGFHDQYEMQEQIGSGSFGAVHVAVHRTTGERYD